jgi:LmbE family N-acetylglucosaminyl deacetylase
VGKPALTVGPPEETGPLREEEEMASAHLVRVETIEFLDHRDGVIEYGLPLGRDIARAIKRHRPNVLITLNFQLTWGGPELNMADHGWVGLAVLDAWRDAANRWIFPELLQEGLQPWSGVKMVCISGSPQADHAVDVTDFLDQGIASLKAHKAYIQNLTGDFDPEAFLRNNASATGKRFGCRYAVGFEVMKI